MAAAVDKRIGYGYIGEPRGSYGAISLLYATARYYAPQLEWRTKASESEFYRFQSLSQLTLKDSQLVQ